MFPFATHRNASGMSRLQLVSPGPYTLPQRKIAIGRAKACAYICAMRSVQLFEQSYGLSPRSAAFSVYGKCSCEPYALSDEATTVSDTFPYWRIASSSVHVPCALL